MPEMPQIDLRENHIRFLKHENTDLIPNELLGTNVMGFGAIDGPAIEKGPLGGGTDGFGVRWVHPASGGGAAIPAPGEFQLEDICDWREVVKIPDPASYDWKADFAMEMQMMHYDTEHKLNVFGFGNGVYERLASLMGFEDALIAMATDPEEVDAFFTAVTDYKIAALPYIIEAYHPDAITYYDDVATERDTFMSPKAFRELIAPHHKRFVDACKSYGLFAIYHCCGHAESLVEDMIACGWDAWSSVQPSNDICSLIETWGRKIGFIGGFDSNGRPATMDAPHDAVVAECRRCYDEYGKYGYGYSFFGFRYANTLDPAVIGKLMGEVAEAAISYGFELYGKKMAALHAQA